MSSPTIPAQIDANHHSRAATRRLLLARLDDVRAEERAAAALSAKAVHRMRVAVRRLRAGLDALGAGQTLEKDERHAKQLQDALGSIRDLQVLQHWVQRHARRSPVGPKLERELAEDLEQSAAQLTAAVERWKKHAVRLAQHVADRDGLRPLTGRKMMQRLREAIGDLAEAIQAAGDLTEPIAVHQARIRLKRLRYQLELVEPVMAKKVEGVLQQLRPLQDTLGNLHDADVRHRLLSEEAPRASSSQRARLLRMMQKIHAERDAEARKALRSVKPWLQDQYSDWLSASFC